VEQSRITLGDLDTETRAVLLQLYWHPMQTEQDIARIRRLSGRASRHLLQRLKEMDLAEARRGRYQIAPGGRVLILEQRKLAVARDREARASRKQDQGLLADEAVRHAVSVMAERAEREPDKNQLFATFVDPGLTEQLHNTNHQIIYGRRGTGKTHVMQVLFQNATDWPRRIAMYVDMRRLGTSGAYEDTDRPLASRVTSLLRTLLTEIHTYLLDVATHPAVNARDEAFEALEALEKAIVRGIYPGANLTVEQERSSKHDGKSAIDVSIAPQPQMRFGMEGTKNTGHRERTVHEGTALERVDFQAMASSLTRVLAACGIERYTLLLDEWSAVPFELQPWLADFLRRGLCVVPEATVKIAAIEYRSNFSERVGKNRLGFELSSEISAAIDLDDYFVYDRNRQDTEELFAEMLYRHLAVELETGEWLRETDQYGSVPSTAHGPLQVRDVVGDDGHIISAYLTEMHGIDDPAALVKKLFGSSRVFAELVRAAEGVARDFILIFTKAYFRATKSRRSKIDTNAIRDGARIVFDEKVADITKEQEEALGHLIREVLGAGKARAFLLEKRDARHDLIRSLFDSRLIHLVQGGFVDPSEPARWFNVYTLDYGVYAPLLNTLQAPQGDFTTALRGVDGAVALDKERWIRRIILDPEKISRHGESMWS